MSPQLSSDFLLGVLPTVLILKKIHLGHETADPRLSRMDREVKQLCLGNFPTQNSGKPRKRTCEFTDCNRRCLKE